MKPAAIACLILALPCLGGCVAAVVGGAAAGGYYVGKDDRSAERIAADAAITADVKARLILSGHPLAVHQRGHLQRQCHPEG
jgi:osmotically-inducible protein OsmY